MRTTAIVLLLLGTLAADAGSRTRAIRPRVTAADCAAAPGGGNCSEDGTVSVAALQAAEVESVVRAAASSIDDPTATIAVVDRTGRVLALFRKPGADPANDDQAVGVARTAAFFSHNQAPLSSRTVRYISGVHFPPGITNTASAALYGIENTNRGCDFNVDWNEGKCIPRARSFTRAALRCDPADSSGCGPGIVTGKAFPGDLDADRVNAGGIPLYRIPPSGLDRADEGAVSDGQLIGAVGVAGISGDPQRAEFAAVSGAFGAFASASGPIVPVPFYPLPQPGNVFVDGIRLPFLGRDQRLTFNGDGLPTGIRRREDTRAGTDAGTFVQAPVAGHCTPSEYLVGPKGGTRLSAVDVDAIVRRAVQTAKRTRAAIRLPLNRYTRMAIAVADLDGSLLALYRMPDSTIFSLDVAVAKSRNVVYFSANGIGSLVPAGVAVSNRTIGFGAQPFFPPGINSSVLNPVEGPWYRSLYVNDLENRCSQGAQPENINQNGVVFFAGSTPLHRGAELVGGLGVSGDGIEQDDYVTYFGAGELLPDQSLWADRLKVDGVRLPMFKFPRQPEGVTECGGGACE